MLQYPEKDTANEDTPMILDLPPALETTLQETAIRRGISKERLAYEYIHQMATTPPAKSYASGDFNFDLERMKQAVETPTKPIPKEAMQDLDSFDAWMKGAFA